MSDSVRPHGRQPTRLPHPWDSPGKNTGVGCHFLLQCLKVKSQSEVAQLCPTLHSPMDCGLPGSSVHGIFQARILEWGTIAFCYLTYFVKTIKISSAFSLSIVNLKYTSDRCWICVESKRLASWDAWCALKMVLRFWDLKAMLNIQHCWYPVKLRK